MKGEGKKKGVSDIQIEYERGLGVLSEKHGRERFMIFYI